MTQSLPLDVRFLKRFARRLHQAGVATHQLEGMVRAVSDWLGYHTDIWSNPTAIFMTIRGTDDDEDYQHIPMQLIRLEPGAIDLATMARLYGVGDELISGRLSLEDAFDGLKKSRRMKRFPAWLQVLSYGLVSGSFAVMLASSWQGVITAASAGMLVALMYAKGSQALKAGGMEAIAATLVSLFVYVCNNMLAGIQPTSIIMSGLIVLMPGLSLTIAASELSTNNLTSGASRLAGSLIVLLKLSLGVLIGTEISQWLNWDVAGSISIGSERLPDWVQLPALLMSALSFAVIFNCRLRDFYLAVFAAFTGYGVSRLGVIMGGVEMGVFLAAFTVAVLANLVGRVLKLPASLMRVPGVILLVPGALGYRTVTNVLLQTNPDNPETAMLVATMLIVLVGGLLIGNTIVPPRRYL